MRRTLWLLLLAACSAVDTTWTPFGDPANRPHAERPLEADVHHYAIRVRLDPAEPRIDGSVEISFTTLRRLGAIAFDAADMTVRSAKLDGSDMPFELKNERLSIRLPRPVEKGIRMTATIAYEGRPRRGLHFIRPDAGYSDKPLMVWSHGEAEDNHHWFPCHDYPNDRATSETWVTAPAKFKVISNGKLVDRVEEGGWATTHHRMDVDHVSYLVSIVVADLESYSDRGGVEYHVPKGKFKEAEVRRDLGVTPEAMAFFSSITGVPYPYPKYAQTVVWDFEMGGQENISATTLYQWVVTPSRAAEGYSDEALVVHELAHQWFGDLVTCRSWAHLWLNEGFATYCEWLWAERRYGRAEMQSQMRSGAENYLGEEADHRRPIVCSVFTDPDDMFDSHTYDRGGWILHMLRQVVGDEGWRKGVAHYVKKHARGVVDTRDFRRAMEEATGTDLRWFFDQWVYGMGVPEFEVSHRWEKGKLRLVVEQKQNPVRARCGPLESRVPEAFRVPVEIGIDGAVHRMWIERRRQEFVFDCRSPPRLVSFDRTGSILKRLKWKKSAEELMWQLAHDPEAAGRHWAAEQLEIENAPEAAIAALVAAKDDPCVEIARQAARTLAGIGTGAAVAGLLKILAETKSVLLRKTIYQGLASFSERPEVRAVLREALEKEPNLRCRGWAAASYGRAGAETFDELATFYDRNRDEPYLAPGGLEGLAHADGARAKPLLLEALEYGKHEWLRARALGILFDRWSEKKEEDVTARLLDLVDDPSNGVRKSAIERLGDAGDARAAARIEARLDKETVPDVRKAAAAALRKLRKP
ncbi:MAG: M1 family metallopeptidase [Planctomycetes bacterium]|nr:M1 family metallopeptidase [Planctomycetota bacterium]